ncbi:MAG: sporulation protein YunB [Clostridia bacterium]|nr:sporulation protein YunB [Clostridia bacterium]
MQKIKRRRLSKKRKLIILLSLFLVVMITIFVFFNTYVNPIIITISQAQVKAMTTKAVNSAVQTVINNTDVYDELINIMTDSEGNITMFQVKSIQINKLSKNISRTAQQNLELASAEGVGIPLGTLSGISVLVGLGPEITFFVSPIGSIQSSFSSEFASAGINQTNHRIYLTLDTTVSIVLPTSTKTVSTKSHILICESIIIGKVPDTYLNSTSLDEMLNLVA